MKKFIIFTLILLPLCTGCTTFHQDYPVKVDADYTGVASSGGGFGLICIDGVEYLIGYRKMAPHFRVDEEGRPYLIKCENKN